MILWAEFILIDLMAMNIRWAALAVLEIVSILFLLFFFRGIYRLLESLLVPKPEVKKKTAKEIAERDFAVKVDSEYANLIRRTITSNAYHLESVQHETHGFGIKLYFMFEDKQKELYALFYMTGDFMMRNQDGNTTMFNNQSQENILKALERLNLANFS